MSANLILGSSHVLQFASAVGAHDATWEDASDLVPIRSAGEARNFLVYTSIHPSFLEVTPGEGGAVTATFGPLIEKIRAFNEPQAKVVFGVAGNEHNLLFLRAQQPLFDFVHPDHPDVEPGRQIVPLAVMRLIISRYLRRGFAITQAIAGQLARAQLFYLPPPPPVPSEAQIRSNPEVFAFDEQPVEAASVRLKIYELYLETAQAFCARAGLTFIAPPEEHRDAQGFLKAEFWCSATHAAPAYYSGIVSTLGL